MKNKHYYAVSTISENSYVAAIFADRDVRDGYVSRLRSRHPDMRPAAWSERHIREVASQERNLVQGLAMTDDVPSWIEETGKVTEYDNGTSTFMITDF